MTAVRQRWFFDTSVLVGGIIELGERSEASQALMTAVASRKVPRPTTGWHCCLEFYSVVTRLPVEFRVSSAAAVRLIEEEIDARFDVHGLPHDARKGFWRMAERERVAGGRIYDAHIPEVARQAGADVVVTENRRHFTPLLPHPIRVLGAADALALL